MAVEIQWNAPQLCAIHLLEKWGFELVGDEGADYEKALSAEHRPVLRRTRQDGRTEQVTVNSIGSHYWRLVELGRK